MIYNLNDTDIEHTENQCHCFTASCQYKIDGIKCNYTRGSFHTITGVFMAYENQVNRSRIEILVVGCSRPDCFDNKPFYTSIDILEESGGFIECDYHAGSMLYPKVGK